MCTVMPVAEFLQEVGADWNNLSCFSMDLVIAGVIATPVTVMTDATASSSPNSLL